jgi:hypothetical protein
VNFYDECLREPLWRAHEAVRELLKAIREANPQEGPNVDVAGPAALRVAAQLVMDSMTLQHQVSDKLRMAADLLEEHKARASVSTLMR